LIEDNRDHTYWIMDDLATDTNEQRVALYEKWKDKFQDTEYFTRYSERVITLKDTDGDGKADKLDEFAGDFDEPADGPAIGLIYGNGNKVYMTCIPHVWVLEDTDGDGVADKKESLVEGFGPKNSLSGHDLHGLAWGPDGKLYFSMGDRGYNITTKEGKLLVDTNTGAAFRCNPDGSDLEIFYHNLRNPQELAFNEYGDLFTVDNNCDQGDSARVCYLIEGGDTGWHLGTQALTTYTDFIEDAIEDAQGERR
jgi:quinoprotein glucose dehydrogenase